MIGELSEVTRAAGWSWEGGNDLVSSRDGGRWDAFLCLFHLFPPSRKDVALTYTSNVDLS